MSYQIPIEHVIRNAVVGGETQPNAGFEVPPGLDLNLPPRYQPEARRPDPSLRQTHVVTGRIPVQPRAAVLNKKPSIMNASYHYAVGQNAGLGMDRTVTIYNSNGQIPNGFNTTQPSPFFQCQQESFCTGPTTQSTMYGQQPPLSGTRYFPGMAG